MPLSLEQLAESVQLTPDQVRKVMAPFPVDIASLEWQSLVVHRGQEMVLRPDDQNFRSSVRGFRPRSLDEVREMVGIPRRIFAKPRTGPARPLNPRLPVPEMPRVPVPQLPVAPDRLIRIPKEALTSIPEDARFTELKPEARTLVKAAANNLVYANVSDATAKTALYRVAERFILDRSIIIGFLKDVVVESGAKLFVDQVAGLTAFRIKIYKGGQILTGTYGAIHCHSVEGGL